MSLVAWIGYGVLCATAGYALGHRKGVSTWRSVTRSRWYDGIFR